MPKYTFVYLRDPDSNGCCAACVEHIKIDENRTNLRIAFSFSSPDELQFEKKISRNMAIERMEAGKFILIEKRKGKSTYDTVRQYFINAARELEEDGSSAESLFRIKPYKVGSISSLTSEFWGWLFYFSKRV